MTVDADTIRDALRTALPDERPCELTFDVLAVQETHDHRDFLAEIGAEALAEEPIAQQLAAIVELVRRRDSHVVAPVSLVEGARRLGISKGRTLIPAIKRGAVRTVKVGGRLKIALDELDRVAVEGLGPVPRRRSRPAAATGKRRDLAAELTEVRSLRFPKPA